MFERLSKGLGDRRIRYWEFRKEGSENNTIVAWNNEIKKLTTDVRRGCSIRLLYNDAWSFVYFENLDHYKEAVRKAIKIARALDSRKSQKKAISLSGPVSDEKRTRMKTDPRAVSLEEKKRLVLGLSKPPCDRTKNNQIIYFDQEREMEYCNSEQSCIRQNLVYCYCGASVTVQSNGVMESFDIRHGGLCGYEITRDLARIAAVAHRKALSLTKAVVPHGGQYPVVCDPGLTDVFIHEALGHATEADLVQSGDSCLRGKMGRRLALEAVNVYDDATVPGSWGSFFYDDEGVAAQKTQLIKDGRLVSFLHSRETASAMDAGPTGNARAQGVSHVPQVRMSNTYIGKGEFSKQELFEGIKEGVFLAGSRGGQVDTAKGNFQFSAQEGHMIRDGRLAERLRGVSLAGNTLETLANIIRISDRYQNGFPGFCGKGGQSVPATGNCPHILIKKAVVGGK